MGHEGLIIAQYTAKKKRTSTHHSSSFCSKKKKQWICRFYALQDAKEYVNLTSSLNNVPLPETKPSNLVRRQTP